MRVIDGLERKKEENKKRYFMLSFPTITFKPLTFRSESEKEKLKEKLIF